MKIEEDLSKAYPGLRVFELRLNQLSITRSDEKLDQFKRTKQNEIRDRVGSLEAIKNVPVLRAYRDFYWKVGIDPTKTRPAGEALTRRILAGKDLPTINTLVDSYNIASAESSIAIAAFDMQRVNVDSLVMRRAWEGESFLGIGMTSEIKLSGIEVVIEDTHSKKLIAIYPYRDSDDSKVTEETSDVLLMMCGVPGIGDEALNNARNLSAEYIQKFCKNDKTRHE
jgi:DNA/RNA-binding domain of Phe-tRNA-synthetase-like protein